MKRILMACCLALLTSSPVLAAVQWFQTLETEEKPERVGYTIERRDLGDAVCIEITLKPKAAKVFRKATLFLYCRDSRVLETDVAATDRDDGGKQISLTVAKANLPKSAISVSSGMLEGAGPDLFNCAGFRLMLLEPPAAERRLLDFKGLTTLDAEIAKELAAAEKWNGDLSGVTALDSPDSVSIAKALATREGPLHLPNLKKISPKTLTALIQKEDVEIPFIETLELIQEPDGSVTEDFVIPDGIGDRQKRQRR
jgi:hypothetical protein